MLVCRSLISRSNLDLFSQRRFVSSSTKLRSLANLKLRIEKEKREAAKAKAKEVQKDQSSGDKTKKDRKDGLWKKFKRLPIVEGIMREIKEANVGKEKTKLGKAVQKRKIKVAAPTPATERLFSTAITEKTEAKYTTKFPPDGEIPEVCLAGRSNVGKSSLLNGLLYHNYAKWSSDQGETKALGFYNMNNQLRLVDLPGWGFAFVSEQERERWLEMMKAYFVNRKSLKRVLFLMDPRVDLKWVDQRMLEFMNDYAVPYSIVFTKCDSVSPTFLARRTYQHLQHPLIQFSATRAPGILYCSSLSKGGLVQLRNAIAKLSLPEPFDADAQPESDARPGRSSASKLLPPTQRSIDEKKLKPILPDNKNDPFASTRDKRDFLISDRDTDRLTKLFSAEVVPQKKAVATDVQIMPGWEAAGRIVPAFDRPDFDLASIWNNVVAEDQQHIESSYKSRSDYLASEDLLAPYVLRDKDKTYHHDPTLHNLDPQFTAPVIMRAPQRRVMHPRYLIWQEKKRNPRPKGFAREYTGQEMRGLLQLMTLEAYWSKNSKKHSKGNKRWKWKQKSRWRDMAESHWERFYPQPVLDEERYWKELAEPTIGTRSYDIMQAKLKKMPHVDW
eukprot:TRINITY_DN63718_c0_g2_i1.p1 TRINITY_DN63718_c0_g2~~TRINITY_DN63718_c0_g2_i1.p1  ORF type:complete len:614 (+),score=28.68 TRINITY_DN63718_c0_g2_i1:42-1883(+)